MKKVGNMQKKKLSESIERKFIETIDINDYEVLTDNGWADIASISKTVPYQVWEVKTETHSLKCADNHIVFDEDMNEVFVKDLHVGQKIATDAGFEKVIDVQKHDEVDNMYDIEVDDENHRYYTDGILSHNSTMYCIYSLWLTTFFPEKKVMILANKLATALELLSRIQTGYEYLPAFLKSGCTVFNKGELSFSNMSSIRAFASSSDAARGFSCNCVRANTHLIMRLSKLPFLKFKIKIRTLQKVYDVIQKVKHVCSKIFKRAK